MNGWHIAHEQIEENMGNTADGKRVQKVENMDNTNDGIEENVNNTVGKKHINKMRKNRIISFMPIYA